MSLAFHGGVKFKNFEFLKYPRIKRVPVRGCPVRAPRTPESQGTTDGGLSVVRDRGNGLKARPVVYCWTNGAAFSHQL